VGLTEANDTQIKDRKLGLLKASAGAGWAMVIHQIEWTPNQAMILIPYLLLHV